MYVTIITSALKDSSLVGRHVVPPDKHMRMFWLFFDSLTPELKALCSSDISITIYQSQDIIFQKTGVKNTA